MKIIAKIIILSCLSVLVFACTAVASSEAHIVQEGDTLWMIAHHNGTTVEKLMEINGLTSDSLSIGQVILLDEEQAAGQTSENKTPDNVKYVVQPGDSLWRIAIEYGITLEELMRFNQLKTDVLNPGTELIIPYQGVASRSGSNANAARLLELAAQHLGTPYRSGGKSPGGFDCSGFAQYVFGKVGINLPRTAAEQASVGTKVTREQLLPGDLVYFRCGGGIVDHVGIYVGNNRFIHSSSPRSGGVIYSSLAEDYYARSYAGARRILR
ncbi:MAG: NlpC/P60 family protein [Bacillota bacterium]|nr:NlpC/P60 family protein [Bacillota bacterium]